ncbi:hypothetical protein niasHT_021578 [Heterodera trifolii]|uniref:Uncharacterized protein n=1 Tax=Heterodera trifolii TaxID=157864 RepID=A0ABD2KRW7_9BILA
MFTIWPMLKDTIRLMSFNAIAFRQMRQLDPSMLNDCASLRAVVFNFGILPEFPPDDSANASDGQSVTKWLFTPRHDNLPKLFFVRIENSSVDQWLATVEHIKAAFSSASSPIAFFILIDFSSSSSLSSVVPFKLTNELTGEKLKLSQEDANVFKLIRRPIGGGGGKKWKKEIKKAVEQKNNKIEIYIRGDGVDNGLLDSSPGPSGAYYTGLMRFNHWDSTHQHFNYRDSILLHFNHWDSIHQHSNHWDQPTNIPITGTNPPTFQSLGLNPPTFQSLGLTGTQPNSISITGTQFTNSPITGTNPPTFQSLGLNHQHFNHWDSTQQHFNYRDSILLHFNHWDSIHQHSNHWDHPPTFQSLGLNPPAFQSLGLNSPTFQSLGPPTNIPITGTQPTSISITGTNPPTFQAPGLNLSKFL